MLEYHEIKQPQKLTFHPNLDDHQQLYNVSFWIQSIDKNIVNYAEILIKKHTQRQTKRNEDKRWCMDMDGGGGRNDGGGKPSGGV